jgi:hypothetical protein
MVINPNCALPFTTGWTAPTGTWVCEDNVYLYSGSDLNLSPVKQIVDISAYDQEIGICEQSFIFFVFLFFCFFVFLFFCFLFANIRLQPMGK